MRQAFLGRSALGFAALAANFGRPTQSVDAVQTAIFSDYPGGRQDLIFAGSGNELDPRPDHDAERRREVHPAALLASDLDWNGVNLLPQLLLNMKFN